MRYALPAIFFALFAAMVVLGPHLEPRRLRARSAAVEDELRTKYGFTTGSHASWIEARSTEWPPFHYGTHRDTDGELVGLVDGLTVRVAGYECVNAGTRHRYGLACILLPATIAWAEVRGEPAFSGARVPDHVPDGHRAGASSEFDAAFQIFAEEPQAVMMVTAGTTAQAMLEAPERFSWRALNGEVLLWRRGGWASAETLLASLDAVRRIVDEAVASSWLS